MAGGGASLIDLFAGCGGLAKGFDDTGFDVIAAVENNLSAAATFAQNFPSATVYHRDVQYYRDVHKVDVVVGGPPCQGFSSLGLRDPNDPRNKMWRRYVRVVRKSECKVFVLENVDRFADSPEIRALGKEAAPGGLLEGFTLETYRLNAADYGAPQRRLRTIIIGSRIGPIGAPAPTHSSSPIDGLQPWRTVSDAIEDLDWNVEDTSLPESEIEFGGKRIPGAFTLQDIHVGRRYTQLSLDRFVHVKEGGNRHDLPEELKSACWKKHESGSGDVLGRLEWDKPSVTVRTEFFKPEKGRYLHPHMHRALTHAEAARLQGFDDQFVWCGSKIQIAKMIGNAVPPPLAAAVAQQVAKALVATN